MKITQRELVKIIQEEVESYKKVKLLENRRREILQQLNEMQNCSECGRPMEEDNMEEGIGDFIKKAGEKVAQAGAKLTGQLTGSEKQEAIKQMLKSNATGYPQEIEKALKDQPDATRQSVEKQLMDILMKKAIEKNEKTGMYTMYEASKPTRLLWDSDTKSWKSAQSAAKVTGSAASSFSEGKK